MSARPVVLVTRKLPAAVEARLQRDYDARLNPTDRLYSKDELVEQARGAQAILPCHTEHFSSDVLERLPAELHRLPVCVAKTHLSLSHDPELTGAPRDFVLPVRELRAYTGAGWIVAVCGDTQTMPGLPPRSAAERMDLDAEGRIVGLA